MITRAETAQQYLNASISGDIDTALWLLADDAVINRVFLGTFHGKEAIADALRSQPPVKPRFETPQETGDQVKVKGKLTGLPIGSLTWTFTFEGDQIKRIDVGL